MEDENMGDWKWEGMMFVDSPSERRVVDKAEAEEKLADIENAMADWCDQCLVANVGCPSTCPLLKYTNGFKKE